MPHDTASHTRSLSSAAPLCKARNVCRHSNFTAKGHCVHSAHISFHTSKPRLTTSSYENKLLTNLRSDYDIQIIFPARLKYLWVWTVQPLKFEKFIILWKYCSTYCIFKEWNPWTTPPPLPYNPCLHDICYWMTYCITMTSPHIGILTHWYCNVFVFFTTYGCWRRYMDFVC